MELRHLRYFVAVAEERNFTRAAERLHIAQPPLSRQIQQLEEDLGVVLIEKGVAALRLTEAGQFFLAHAKPLLDQVRDLKAMTQRVGKLERTLVGRLRRIDPVRPAAGHHPALPRAPSGGRSDPARDDDGGAAQGA
jgi:DNA-binding transcriptional LysR family regulator